MRVIILLGTARFSAGVVGVVLDEEGRMLLVEHVFHPRHPWGLPGGWLRHKERPQDALRREMLEELGLDIEVLHPIVVDTSYYGRHIDMAYFCKARGEITKLSGELLNYDWVVPIECPRLSKFHQKAVDVLSTQLATMEVTA